MGDYSEHITALRVLIVSGAVKGRAVEYSGDQALAMTDHLNAIEAELAAIRALPAAEPAEDVRAGALREATEAVSKAREAVIHSGNRAYIDGISVGHDRAERAILALIPEQKP